MDTRIKRILSFAVAFFMVIGMMPVNVVRAEGTEGDDTEIVAETTAPETTPHVCEYAAVVTAPTCEAAGFTTYTCSCGDAYTADEVEATGHTYGEDDKCACGALNPEHAHSYTSVVTAPTCDAAGFTTNTCVCGDVTTTDEVAATGHTYGEDDKCACGALNPEHAHSYTSVVTAPTCDAAGYTTNTCVCGDVTTTDEVAATGHTYGENGKCACGALNPEHAHSYTSVVTAPTCDVAGFTTNTCACGDVTTTDEVAATGHTYGENGKCACGALDPAHEHAYVEGKCVCGDERILMMSPAPSTEPTVKPCEEGCWMEEGHEGECEIICTKDERCVLEDGHEGLCEAFGGMTLQEPQATVTRLDSIVLTAAEHDYMILPSGDSSIDRPLQIVMNFKANDTLEEAQASVYGKYKCDFYLTVSGLASGSLVADDCYLAGNYGDYGWIVISTDGLELEGGVSYPVVSQYDANLTYENICDYVKDFTAAIFIAPKLLNENPNMQVKLELRMTNPTNEEDVLVIGEPAVYDVAALRAGMPDNTVAKIGNKEFSSLQDAIENVAEGETIVLQKNITMTDGITITDKNITIDLNDYTFTVSEGASTNNRNIKINGTSVVTVKNGTLVAAGNYSSGAYGTIRTEGSADVTLTDLKLYNYRGNGLNVKACSGSTVTMSDVEVFSEYGGGIESAGGTIELTGVTVEQKGMYTAPYNSMAISVNTGGKVTVNSGSYTTVPLAADDANNQGSTHGSWAVGVLNSGGTLIINGGTFANGNFGDDALATHARGLINADTAANIQINGGTFNALQGVVDYLNNLGDASRNPVVTVKGGNYSANPSVTSYGSVVIPAGYEVVQENARYIVQWKTVEVTPPSDFEPDVSGEIASEDISEAVKKITEDIESSKTVKEVSGLPKETTLSVKFVSASVEANENSESSEKVVTTKITYDVTPVDADGKEVELTDEITFRLPVPGYIYDHMDKAYVYHGNELLGIYDVKGTAPDRYVEVSAKDFSEYAIELIDVSDADVAQIGAEGYATLQAAVNAVKNNETITLIKGCAETVSVNKSNVKFTIDGGENTYTGTIKIKGGQNLTIKNFNFVHTDTANGHDFIKNEGLSTSEYNTELVVDSCTFIGNGKDADVAARIIHPADLTIQNCSGSGLHSFLQNTGGQKVTIDTVEVTNSKSGFALGGVRAATVKNAKIAASDIGYGIRIDAATDSANIAIESCEITAFIPVVARKASANKVDLTINGTNTLTEKNTDGIKIAVGTSEYEKNGVKPTATTGRVVVTVNDTALAGTLTEENYQSIMAGAVQKCGNKYLTIAADAIIGAKYYDKLSEAAAAGGNVVVLKDIVLDAPIEVGKNVTLTAEEPVTITATGDAFTIKKNASLTIGKNITIDASMTASGENAVLSVTEGTVASAKSEKDGKINVSGGTVDKAIAGQDGIVTISGGDIEAVKLLEGASENSTITGGNIGTVTSAVVVKFVSGGIFENEVAQKYLMEGMECVKSADKFIVKKKAVFAAAYTKKGSIYGEAEHIVAYDSFVVDLYDADGNVIATSALVDKADGSSELLDGYVELITWNILLPGTTDSWWNTQWADTHPRADIQPAKVVLKADGVKVGEANVQMNASDNLKPVKWPELDGVNVALVIDGEGNPTGYDTVIGAIHAAIDAKAPEVQLLVSTEEKMVTDEVLLLKADLTLTAKEAVTAKFYNSGTEFDFVFNSESGTGRHTLTIGENVNFTLADRVIWAGHQGNNVNVVVDGTLAGSQYWHGADTTINATGTLKSTGEALVMRRGATMTVNGGKVDANYFNILSGNIEAKDADINTGAFWIANTGDYAGEGSVYINLDNSSLIGTGNLSVDATSSALIELVNGSVMTVALHNGTPSKISDTGMIWVDNSTLNMKAATLNGAIDVYNGGLLNLAGTFTNKGTVTVFADSMIEAATIDGTGNVVIDTSEMTNTEPVDVMKLSGEYDETKITVDGNAAKKIAAGDPDVVSVYFDVFVDADGDKAVDAGEGYGTLEAAVAAAEHGQTIYILHDTGSNEQAVVEKDITITAQAPKEVSTEIVVKNGATLTLGKNVKFASEICANGGAVVVDGAEVTAAHAEKGGTITVNSGAVKTASATDGNSALNVTGGSVTSASSEYGAQINVSGGTVGSVIANKMGFANISAGEITDVKASGEGAAITITGGEISGSVVAADDGKILIIGGWFASNPAKDDVELAQGMKWDEETGYIVHGDYVAFIDDNDNGIVDEGETGFETIEEAVAAENETVKLLNNLTAEITIEKSVTIDLNGYKTGDVTVKSGDAAIIDSSDNAGYGIDGEITVEEGAGLELADVKTRTIKASGKLTIGEGAEVESIVANTGADVTIADGTINNGISVHGGAVTIKGGRINGEIAIDEDADENASIDIFSGIFSKPVPAEYCADGYIPVNYEDGTYGVELSVVRYIDLSKVADGKIKAGDEIYIDGDAYPVGEDMTVEIPNAVAKKSVMVLTTYTYKNAGQAGAYPTAMYVWLVKGDKNADGDDIYDTFKTERVSALDNFFKYEGTSIRVGNAKNGIRFFTSVHADNANKLMQGKLITSGDLAGVKMVSAGTEFWKTADNKQRSEVYGGKVGSTFRVFQSKGGRNWFTGVLTGLNTDAATIKETINNRPYAQLKLADGTIVTLYGGTLGRSILYVATQNRNTFGAGTASDNFIEGLIAKGNK